MLDFAPKDKRPQVISQHRTTTTAPCCCLSSTWPGWRYKVERAGALLAMKKPSVEIDDRWCYPLLTGNCDVQLQQQGWPV